MSTSRVRAAIQRMARFQPDIDAAIQATRNRGDQAGATGVGQDDQDDRVCCDGSFNDNANPGTSQVDPDEGGQDASDGLDSNDPANLDMGGGSLTGLTDCETGEPVCFEGSSCIPPDGWESCSEPPLDDSYEEGKFYYYRGNLDLQPVCCSCAPTQSLATERFLDCTGRASTSGFELIHTICNDSVCVGDRNGACSPTDDEIREATWPSDGCVNLAIKSGTIVGSKYDPDQDGSYSKPMSEIELCDGNGNKVGIKPSASGGWKTINAVTGEDGYLYDSSGQQIAHIDGNEYSDPAI